jgi:hypothetical protein
VYASGRSAVEVCVSSNQGSLPARDVTQEPTYLLQDVIEDGRYIPDVAPHSEGEPTDGPSDGHDGTDPAGKVGKSSLSMLLCCEPYGHSKNPSKKRPGPGVQ